MENVAKAKPDFGLNEEGVMETTQVWRVNTFTKREDAGPPLRKKEISNTEPTMALAPHLWRDVKGGRKGEQP